MYFDSLNSITANTAKLSLNGDINYTDERFLKAIGPSQDELKSKRLLCDCIIEVGTEKFHVHRCVLAATSPYFRTMFAEDWKESQQGVVKLKDTKASGFEKILQFAYTGHAELNEQILEEVLASANHYCYPALIELCKQYMLTTIDARNCLYYLKIAEMYCVQSVLDKAVDMVQCHFNKVIETTEFLDLSKDALCQFLCSDKPHQNTGELDLFHSVCKWLTHKPERRQLAAEVMKHIKFNLLSSEELKEHVIKCEVVRQDQLCTDLVFESLLVVRKSGSQPTASSSTTKSGERDSDGQATEMNNLFIFDGVKSIITGTLSDNSVNLHRLNMPIQGMSKYSGIACGNYFILIADKMSHPRGMRSHQWPITNEIFIYDSTTRRWQQIPVMNWPQRSSYALVAMKETVTLLGGLTSTGEMLNYVEQYNIVNKTWQILPVLPQPCCSLAACSYRESIYISGGLLQGGRPCANMYVNDPTTQGWVNLAGMPLTSYNHSMIRKGREIYVLHKNSSMCCMYSIDGDCWSRLVFSNIREIQHPASAIVYNDAIYILGTCPTPGCPTHKNKLMLCLIHLDINQNLLTPSCINSILP